MSDEKVVPFRTNYGTKENPVSAPPPIGPQGPFEPAAPGQIPEGADPFDPSMDWTYL
jgi:hypothetical protein